MRRLAAEEEALWAKVAATVQPLPGRRAPKVAGVAPAQSPPPPQQTSKPFGPQAGSPPQRHATPARDTLDGGWDRRLGSGRVVPDQVIDLHGLSRESARSLLLRRVDAAERLGHRVLLVITGKGQMPGPAPADLMPGASPQRGAIRASLPRWLGEEGVTSRIAAVRPAHPRHGGAGAVYIVLKRSRTATLQA